MEQSLLLSGDRNHLDLQTVLADARVRTARGVLHETDPQTLAEQLELVAIPAPPFGEEARAAEIAVRFTACGLVQVHADSEGNRLGLLPNATDPSAPPVIVAAHLDTVFPAGTPVHVRHSGSRIYAPGITDNTRGLAALLAIARALHAARVRTRHPVVFAATVGEEGFGDLRGVKHLFRDGSALRGARSFVALDGSGMRRVVHRAVGSRRFRITVRGPGGHSWADRGTANPIDAVSRTVATLSQPDPASSLSVGRMEGGSSINAIPEEAWFEVDLRSERAEALHCMERQLRQAAEAAVAVANQRRRAGTGALRLDIQLRGNRPAGETPQEAPVVKAALGATRALGTRPELVSASTDANVPIALGVPAVTLGAGGDGGGIHTAAEWYANRGGARGVERALLVVLALAEVAP